MTGNEKRPRLGLGERLRHWRSVLRWQLSTWWEIMDGWAGFIPFALTILCSLASIAICVFTLIRRFG